MKREPKLGDALVPLSSPNFHIDLWGVYLRNWVINSTHREYPFAREAYEESISRWPQYSFRLVQNGDNKVLLTHVGTLYKPTKRDSNGRFARR